MGRMVGIAEFKAKAERLLHQMEQDGEPIELTRRGKVVGVLSPPPRQLDSDSVFGSMKGTVTVHGDLDEPLEPDWEAKWEAKWDDRGFPAMTPPR
jgi:antitoxin (DNA-binding transcriptional repressor) of toxin-antitoxin stability system